MFSAKRTCFVYVGKELVFQNKNECYSLKSLTQHRHIKAKVSKAFVTSNSKRAGLAPAEAVVGNLNVGFRTLLKPLIFTTCFSGCCFLGASIWQYENMRKKVLSHLIAKWITPQHPPPYKRGEIRQKLHYWWNNQTEGEKIASGIIAINCFIFLLWRVPALQPFMVKYFLCSPAMKATCVPMFLSTFSHFSFLHLAANMFVLYSFSTTSVSFFGKEQFLAVYCSAGVISSFSSHLYKVASGRFATSLGASGALMAILSSSCVQFPDALLKVIFLPFIVIPAGHDFRHRLFKSLTTTKGSRGQISMKNNLRNANNLTANNGNQAIKLLMAVDTIGLLAKWKLFDHASHLGGAVFGILYLKYGGEYIWNKREPLMLWWHKIREGR